MSLDNLDWSPIIIYSFSAILCLVVYWLFKKILFKKTFWSMKSFEGLLGYILLVFQTGTLFQHYFLSKFLLRNPEGFLLPEEPLEIFLRIVGIFILPTIAKFIYLIRDFVNPWRRKIARLIMFSSPIFLLYLSLGNLVKQVPSNNKNYIYIWVASLLIDLFFAFFSSKWPVFRPIRPTIEGWFLKRYFRKIKYFFQSLRVWGRRLLPIALAIFYLSTIYGGTIDAGSLYENKTRYCIEDENHQVVKYITYKQYIQFKNPGRFRKFCIAISLPVSAPLSPFMPKRYLGTRTERIKKDCQLSLF